MAVVALTVLLIASFAGLAVGRWKALGAALPAVPACALLLGPEAGAIALLAFAGLVAGVHLHRVVAEVSVPRRLT